MSAGLSHAAEYPEGRMRELTGAEYPPRLRDLNDPPRVWVTGELPRTLSVAVVGTRYPSEEGRKFARALCASLAAEGIAIVSGGAKGIDVAAHEGALDGGGATVVVAGSSFDRPSPKEHAALYRRVVDAGGAYLSRFPPGTGARRFQFLQRNAVLAALADAVVVVESGVIGGSRSTAHWARRLSRRVLVVPGAPWTEKGLGCVVELRLGGTPVGSYRDVLEAIGRRAGRVHAASASVPVQAAQVAGSNLHPLANPEAERVRQVLLKCPADLDELHVRTGIPVGRLRGLLLTLTLDGVLVSSPSGQLSLTSQ
jgi:DNA processing protein